MAAVFDWLQSRVRAGGQGGPRRLAPYAEVWEKVAASARETEALNLDRRPLILSIFSDLAGAVRASSSEEPSRARRPARAFMSDRPTFSISTAIPYANGAPHIGHAYELIAADAIARFKRIDGYDVHFVTGMDEHGQKMQQTAAKLGITAQALADRTATEFEAMGELLEAQVDDRVRTTEPRHVAAAQAIWQRMQDAGDIYLSKYPGWYSVRDEAFFDEDELTVAADGTKRRARRRAGRVGRGGELLLQAFGLRRAPAGALRGAPRVHRPREVPQRDRRLRRARPQRPLHQPFDLRLGHPGAGRPQARHVRLGRRSDQLPHRHGLAGGSPSPSSGRWTSTSSARTSRASTRSSGRPSSCPRSCRCPGRSWSTASSSTRGRRCRSRSATSSTRRRCQRLTASIRCAIFFLREVPFGQDGNYSHEAIVNRTNAELSNDLGNLSQRSLSMIAKNCEGRVPDARRADAGRRGAARRRARPARARARGHGRLHAASGAGPHLARRGRRQPLLRRRRALGQEEDGSRAHGHDPLRDGGGRAHLCHSRAAVHAVGHGAHARRARRGGGQARHRRDRGGGRARARHDAASADADLPALCRGVKVEA